MPHPRAYDRVKGFIKDAFIAMAERKQDYPLLMELGVKRASKDLKKQLEAFWMGEAPFPRLEPERLKGVTPFQYWKRYETDPHGRVLAVRPATLDRGLV